MMQAICFQSAKTAEGLHEVLAGKGIMLLNILGFVRAEQFLIGVNTNIAGHCSLLDLQLNLLGLLSQEHEAKFSEACSCVNASQAGEQNVVPGMTFSGLPVVNSSMA